MKLKEITYPRVLSPLPPIATKRECLTTTCIKKKKCNNMKKTPF